MKKIQPLLLLLTLFSYSISLVGQDTTSVDQTILDTIYLNNPSFEDVPKRGGDISGPIKGWEDCGRFYFPSESPPDIHPYPGGAWGVVGKAMDGNTYLGLVIRDNGSWESVSQKLTTVLRPDKCYWFHAWLSISPVYQSGTRVSYGKLQNFSHPAVLRIWGGSEVCDRLELLSVSYPVANHDWKECVFYLSPTVACQSITLEAFYYFSECVYSKEKINAYNGHIMIDHLSPIMEIECK